MIPEDDTLIGIRRAVLLKPDDDLPRLLYAERLDELPGDYALRAEFIKVGVEVYRGRNMVPREDVAAYQTYLKLKQRERNLLDLKQYAAALNLRSELPRYDDYVYPGRPDLKPVPRNWALYLEQSEDYAVNISTHHARWSRGFCDRANLDLEDVPAVLGPLLALQPVGVVYVRCDVFRTEEFGRGPLVRIEINHPTGRKRKWRTIAFDNEENTAGDNDIWSKAWDSRDGMVVGVGRWVVRAATALARMATAVPEDD